MKAVERFSTNIKHPYSKFLTGNKYTLGGKKSYLRKDLIKFHRKWYLANIMKLSVLGKGEFFNNNLIVR